MKELDCASDKAQISATKRYGYDLAVTGCVNLGWLFCADVPSRAPDNCIIRVPDSKIGRGLIEPCDSDSDLLGARKSCRAPDLTHGFLFKLRSIHQAALTTLRLPRDIK